ncbi:TetR/AcrR family transcriptional regulator [Dactylosporangium fulvum]|uniref:TetR/AcrR family transcriptional regulator n=1 Tax=Dactylosporangium fulvum TaxID=53359 RepID=A0ABY5W9P2_9ACTN|nr:TetR/AcrR family transcriptional regulator [Dactylosporangium fulvum]UWP86277.1 TetR/AcrR family transcriptional regulator [Dactylosporangium fulvum]
MPRSTQRPSSSARGERTRAAIMRAATSVFARHGYQGGPLAAVATAADMTQPGVLHHFASKEHLLMAVLEERDRDGTRRLEAGTWNDGGGAALDALQELVDHNTTTPELVQMFTVLVGESVAADHPARPFFTDRYAHLRYRTTRAIQRGQDRGEFRTDADAAELASLVLAVMDGLQIQWLLCPEIDMSTRFATFVDMMKRFLAPDPPAGSGA